MFKTSFSVHSKILGITAPECSPWLRACLELLYWCTAELYLDFCNLDSAHLSASETPGLR